MNLKDWFISFCLSRKISGWKYLLDWHNSSLNLGERKRFGELKLCTGGFYLGDFPLFLWNDIAPLVLGVCKFLEIWPLATPFLLPLWEIMERVDDIISFPKRNHKKTSWSSQLVVLGS
jgi:hypothetical protein